MAIKMARLDCVSVFKIWEFFPKNRRMSIAIDRPKVRADGQLVGFRTAEEIPRKSAGSIDSRTSGPVTAETDLLMVNA